MKMEGLHRELTMLQLHVDRLCYKQHNYFYNQLYNLMLHLERHPYYLHYRVPAHTRNAPTLQQLLDPNHQLIVLNRNFILEAHRSHMMFLQVQLQIALQQRHICIQILQHINLQLHNHQLQNVFPHQHHQGVKNLQPHMETLHKNLQKLCSCLMEFEGHQRMLENQMRNVLQKMDAIHTMNNELTQAQHKYPHLDPTTLAVTMRSSRIRSPFLLFY